MSISSELKAKTLKLTLKFIFGSSNVKQCKKEISKQEGLKEAALNFKKLVTDKLLLVLGELLQLDQEEQ